MNKEPHARANRESLIVSGPAIWVVFGALLIATAMHPRAHAITINIEYTTDTGGEENPNWDENGAILIAHFQAAKAIWEALLPGGGEYTFDFQWDDDLDPGELARTTENAADLFIEFTPGINWYADPTPYDNAEFNLATQRLYSQLSAADQTFYFPGTAPPGGLEVNYQSTGIASSPALNTLSSSGQNLAGTMTPIDASNGFDLLSTVVHEIGHVLGISGTEPGEYNIDPQHVGGLTNVLVLEGGGGHLGGGIVPPATNFNIVPGFLMCNSCGVQGLRRFATATDVLVIAEDQGITVVQLARVGSISSGFWSNANNWIGGDVPDVTQDVYITHGGLVTLDVDAGANNVLVAPGNGIVTQTDQGLLTLGTLTFTGGTLTVGPSGAIFANTLVGNPGSITTAAGSLVRFNQITDVGATAASFGGSVAIGFDNVLGPSTPSQPALVNSSAPSWSIAENLIIADESFANLIVDNGTWTVNGNVTLGKVLTGLNGGWTGGVNLQNNGVMTITGNLDIPLGAITVEDTATLNVTGNITIGKQSGITFRDNRSAPSKPYSLPGGFTMIIEGTPIRIGGGYLTFEDTASAADATVTLEGGSGHDAAGALATFKGDSSAATAEFHTKGGRFGPNLSTGTIEGNGGQVRFEDTSGASAATFFNEGSAGPAAPIVNAGGTGGRTLFAEDSSAEQSTIHNHGATYNSGLGAEPGGGTHFLGNSTAGSANIFNHADGSNSLVSSEARTVFFDSSNAGNATIENEAASGQSVPRGRTEFRNNSSAADATINNRGYLTVGWLAGRTLFYDAATAATADINLFGGYSDDGLLEFRQSSTAGNATIVAHNIPTIVGRPNNGGRIFFYDNSSAGQSQITLRQNGQLSSIQFLNNATAASAQIVTEDGGGALTFFGNSTAASATISLGRSSIGAFNDTSTAANAAFTLTPGSQVQFGHQSSAGAAQFVAHGSSVYPVAGGRVMFNTSTLVNNSTIVAHGGTSSLAAGATVEFINGAHAGNATITAYGPSNGGTGAQITFNSGAKGDNAQLIANAGASVDFMSQRLYGDGSTSVGSIEGAGAVFLRGSHLIIGSLNLSRTISGPITDSGFAGGRLTKVGTGTLTLAGTNNYSGLTTVSAGTLSVTGSLAGGAVVNSGGTLLGTGAIAGNVAVNSGGTLAPGTSPGIITIGSLTMNAGSTLQMELGGTTPGSGYDRIQSAGALAFAGALEVSLYNGFAPSAGQSFDLFNWGSTSGTFSSLSLPSLVGLAWNTSQLYTTGVLSLNAAGVPGDYNNNGSVDAADYVLWRKGGPLSNEVDAPGVVNAADYTAWRARFSNPGAGAGAGVEIAAVPEPTTTVILIGMVAGVRLRRRRIALRVPSTR